MTKEQMARELVKTWDYIGDDVLAVDEHGNYDPNSSTTLHRDQVFELAVDKAVGNGGIPRDEWHALSDEEKQEIKMKAFKGELYGL